jgi:hypothetical protein
MRRQAALVLAALFVAFSPDDAFAGPILDGTALRWPWALPFIGILLTIATGPLLFPGSGITITASSPSSGVP